MFIVYRYSDIWGLFAKLEDAIRRVRLTFMIQGVNEVELKTSDGYNYVVVGPVLKNQVRIEYREIQ